LFLALSVVRPTTDLRAPPPHGVSSGNLWIQLRAKTVSMALVRHSNPAHGRRGGAGPPRPLGPPTDGRPISVPRSAQQVRKWVIRGADFIQLGTAGIALWASTSTNALQFAVYWMSSSPLWSDVAALSDEYHMDYVKVRGIPVQRYNRTQGQTMGAFAMALDNDGLVGTNATTLSQVLGYSTSVVCGFQDEFEITWKIPPTSTGVWYDANGAGATATAQLAELCFFTDGLQTTSLGQVVTVFWEIGVTTRGTRQ
jgi:hypothetical protein